MNITRISQIVKFYFNCILSTNYPNIIILNINRTMKDNLFDITEEPNTHSVTLESDEEFSQALIVITKAHQCLCDISSEHIKQLISLQKPPECIKKIMKAVCIIC